MVHFGRYIKSHQVPGWETYYIQYKQLKKRINECALHAAEGSEEERQEILRRFSKLLDSQLSAVNCESLEEYNVKFWDALLPVSSFKIVPLAD
ncbi:hypothetical protein L7F22_031902 [Adiantum nelumboides]|nr:hypothetical protein [Adiantum nelumboides]